MFVVSVALLQVESDHSSTGVLPSVCVCVGGWGGWSLRVINCNIETVYIYDG